MRRRLLAAAAALPFAARVRAAQATPLVAAASDLKFALTEIAAAFAATTGRGVQLVFGSSGNFARQIRQGAPYELFFSADEGYVAALAEAGRTRDGGLVYGTGRLALLASRSFRVEVDSRLRGLRARLEHLRRFAIANPEHAPYGRAAREALSALGIWETLSARIVRAENVAQAAQFVATGAAQAGLVAWPLLAGGRGDAIGPHAQVDESLHAPLRQRMVLLRGAAAVASGFYEYVQQPPARAALARHGFGPPGGTRG